MELINSTENEPGQMVVLGVLICLLGIVIGWGITRHPNTSKAELVYEYCNNSRLTDTTSEQTCGDLQDFYNVEFLCTDNNKLESNVCWVEEK